MTAPTEAPVLQRGSVVIAPMRGVPGRVPLIVLSDAPGGGWWVIRVAPRSRDGHAPVPDWWLGGFVRAQWLRGGPTRLAELNVHETLGCLPPHVMNLISESLKGRR